MEAFSDAVIAIIITIMVLEFKVPRDATWNGLEELIPTFTCYVLSFGFLAVYWINHHQLVHCIKLVNSKVLWSNMLLLFFLTLIPFSTGWMAENEYARLPVLFYLANIFLCAIGGYVMLRSVTSQIYQDNRLFEVIKGNTRKNIISMGLYVIAFILAFVEPKLSLIPIAFASILWIIPDKRIEKLLNTEN